MNRPLIAALLALPASASAVEAIPASQLTWQWPPAEVRRYLVETEVVLPQFIWFLADQNKEARVSAFQLRATLRCDDIEIEGRRSWDVGCTIEDFAIVASALESDQTSIGGRELVGPILAEMDEKLTGAQVRFVLRDDGRVTSVRLDGLDRANRRIGRMNENLRMVLMRAIAGFDLQLPPHGAASAGIWSQRESMLLVAPNQTGSLGGSETLHRVHEVQGDFVVLATSGRGLVAPVSGSSDVPFNTYDTRVEGAAAFDTKEGVLFERVWTVVGEPTASSAGAEGLAGLPYYQNGRLKLLADDEKPDLGPTQEAASPGQPPTTLQQWPAMGEQPEPAPLPQP